LNKEGIITAVSLMKHFPSEEVAGIVGGLIYDEDIDISIEAIRTCTTLISFSILDYLLEIIERGKKPQKIEALKTLSIIKSPGIEKELLKYYSVINDLDVRIEIIDTLNRLCPDDSRVIELNRSILMDTGVDEKLKCSAVEGLTLGRDFSFLYHYILHASSEVQSRVFLTISSCKIKGAADFIYKIKGEHSHFSSRPLGHFLSTYVLQLKSPNNNYIINLVHKGGTQTVKAFLESFFSGIAFSSSIKNPFRILFLIPYSDQENENKIVKILELLVEHTWNNAPGMIGELSSISSVYLDTLYKKVKKSYIRMHGVRDRDTLRRIILVHLLERYAPKKVCMRVGEFFKKGNPEDGEKLVKLLQNLIPSNDRRGGRRLQACKPLFSEEDRMKRLKTYSILKNIELDSYNLLKRLARIVRVCGILKIKSSIKKIDEIFTFAHEEGLSEIEPECIIALCRLGSKKALQKIYNFIAHSPVQKTLLLTYLKGISFLPPTQATKLLVDILIRFKEPDVQNESILILEGIDFTGFEDALLILLEVISSIDRSFFPRLTEIIIKYANSTMFQRLLDLSLAESSYLKVNAVRILGAVQSREKNIPCDVLTGRLYQLLDDPSEEVRAESLCVLIQLGDDYAFKVLNDWFEAGNLTIIRTILSRVMESILPQLIQKITKLLELKDRDVHELLRKNLPIFCKGQSAKELVSNLISYLGKVPFSVEQGEKEGRVSIIHHPKIEFKFKREHSQVLTVLFIDIAGYTAHSTKTDMSGLMGLLKNFERIVTLQVQNFNGQIVKKLGDGMLCIFKNPASGVMASLFMQREVISYNRYSMEDEKFNVRIGLHTGYVIRKEGDVFGEVVNIASRIQSIANPGEILITEETYQQVKELIICDCRGEVKLKGVERQINAYNPLRPIKEVEEFLITKSRNKIPSVDVRNNDNLQKLKESLFVPRFVFPDKCAESEKLRLLQEMFMDISRASEQISDDYHEEYVFKKYLQERWDELVSKYFKD